MARLATAALALTLMIPCVAPASRGLGTGVASSPAGAAVPAAAPERVWTGTAIPVPEIDVRLTAGVAVIFETVDVSPGSDPVLHLLGTDGKEAAFDDNSGPGAAARLSYRPLVGGSYVLVMRAASNDTDGTASIARNGVPFANRWEFGGWQIAMNSVLKDEEIWTVKLPGGTSTHRLYVLLPGSQRIFARQVGGGTDGAARYVNPFLISPTFVVGLDSRQFVRVLRNDARLPISDPDGDGLGTGLEAALGTCSLTAGTVEGFACSRARDARDSDGDGISDGWEVLGRRDLAPHQPLPKWGADARHKDMFIEVDFRQDIPNEPSLRLPSAEAREFVRIFADELAPYSAAEQTAHASVLGNPDGRPGISVHLDTGINPTFTADRTLFGHWGGYTSVAPVRQLDGSWKPAAAETVWRTAMSPARRGIFHYAMTYSGDSGQTKTGSSSFWPWVASNDNGRTHAHEAGHHLGLGHSGPLNPPIDANCIPNYHSIMNYAFQSDERFGFSHGDMPGTLNNAALRERNAVSPDPPIQVVTDPPIGISAGDLLDIQHLDVLQRDYRYWVDRSEGHVDWNRDGFFQLETSPVRAYANYKPGGSCEYTKYNDGQVRRPLGPISLPLKSTRAPALLRLGARVYVFSEADDRLEYAWSTSNLFCPPSGDSPCAKWTGGGSLTVDAKEGVDAASIRPDRGLVVTTGSDGRLRFATLEARGSSFKWRDEPAVVPGSVRAGGEPSLASMGTCDAYLAYRGLEDQLIRTQHFTCESGWSSARLAVDENGDSLKTATFASPGIVAAHFGGQEETVLYGGFPTTNGTLDLWSYDSAARRWTRTNLMDEPLGRVEGRPALAWVTSSSRPTPGRLYLVAGRRLSGSGRGSLRMRTSYISVRPFPGLGLLRIEKVGLEAWYQNSSYSAYGVDLLFERGRDSNLRAAVTRFGGERSSEVWFRPYSDGILDARYGDSDDWATMRRVLCQRVVSPIGLVGNPIRC